MENFLKENRFKIVLPISILIGCIIFGGFFYANQANKQQSVVDEKKELQNKIAQVQALAEKQIVENAAMAAKNSAVDNSNYSTIVAEWQDRVAQVICYWSAGEARGSATIVDISLPFGLTAITNAHVITVVPGYTHEFCTITNALGSRMITNPSGGKFFAIGSLNDFAYIAMHSPTSATDNGEFQSVATPRLNVCKTADVQRGDGVLILGYPWNGSQMGVTATQGLISGFDGDYYVTDAKIDQGSSGGAAILIKNDCWLGIPTKAVVGIESYGRILKGDIVLSQ